MFKCYKRTQASRQAPFCWTRGSTFYRKLRTLKQKIGEHRPDFVDLVLSVLVVFHLSICMIPLPSSVCPFFSTANVFNSKKYGSKQFPSKQQRSDNNTRPSTSDGASIKNAIQTKPLHGKSKRSTAKQRKQNKNKSGINADNNVNKRSELAMVELINHQKMLVRTSMNPSLSIWRPTPSTSFCSPFILRVT